MAAIDIGAGATNRTNYLIFGSTYIDLANPANATGIITELQIWANQTLPVNTKIGTFYLSGGQYACRAYYTTTTTIVAGALRTITGLSIAVVAGDFLGIYYTSGRIERDTAGGSGVLYKSGDQFGAGLQTYLTNTGNAISIYGIGDTGIEIPTVTIVEPVLYLDQDSFTAEGEITATGGENCNTRGFCYMEGVAGDPTTANQKVYDNGLASYGIGTYYKPITGLNPGTGYRVRAFAINSEGTGYSATIQVTTPIVVAPTAITQPATDEASTTATINGKISEDGGASCEARFGWSKSFPFPYTFPFAFSPEWTVTDWQNSLVKDSVFHEDLTGLDPGIIYTFQTQARSWTDVEEQTVYNVPLHLYSNYYIRRGQRLTVSDRMITTLSFWLSKDGSPTGDITFTIRKISDDSIINSKVWGNASALDATPTKRTVIFDIPVLIDEEVRILCEFNGGDGSNYVEIYSQSTDVKADEQRTRYDGAYSETGADCAYEYAYHLTGEWSPAEYFTTLTGLHLYLTGSLAFSGALSKETTKYLTGELSLSGVLAKTISKYLTGALSFIGTLAAATSGQFYVYLTGSLTFAGSLSKTTTKYLTGVLTPTGKLIKTTTKFITGVLSFLGGIARPGQPHTMGVFTRPYRDMTVFTRSYRDMAVESRAYRDMSVETREGERAKGDH